MLEELRKCLAIDFHDFKKDDEGYSSSMLVTDHWSGYIWDFYLKDHIGPSVITALKVLFGILERQYEIKPKVIECDNEIITLKPAVKKYLNSLFLKLEPSPSYTQDLNEGTEYSGGVVKNKMKSMRMSSKLPNVL